MASPFESFPSGFPVAAEDYVAPKDTEYGINFDAPSYDPMEDARDRDRTRVLKSLYPYGFLNPSALRPDPASLAQPLGILRQNMVQKMDQEGEDGEWNLVEFVPAWTDPDWGDRFTWTGPVNVDDPLVKMYMRPGLLQQQRPALLPDDIATRGVSEVAKRYGIDPAHRDDPFYGQSGITPTYQTFQVALGFARPTPASEQDKDIINEDDLKALFNKFEADALARDQDASEDSFRDQLENARMGIATDLGIDTEIAGAIMAIMDLVFKREEQEEYQRLLLAGNTSNEVRLCGP